MTPRILIVEDNALVSGALRMLFEETGHRVSVAGGVAEAVERCEAERPDVMLLDLTLPDGDGLEALASLRARGAAPPTTAALTGHDDDATRRRCLEGGCRVVLLKPVPARELLRMVGEWTAESR